MAAFVNISEEDRQTEYFNSEAIVTQINPSDIDKLFAKSTDLGEKGIVDFVTALCEVSGEELNLRTLGALENWGLDRGEGSGSGSADSSVLVDAESFNKVLNNANNNNAGNSGDLKNNRLGGGPGDKGNKNNGETMGNGADNKSNANPTIGSNPNTNFNSSNTNFNSTSGSNSNSNAEFVEPRIFSLQKLVEVADANMYSRSRTTWVRLWKLLSSHFASILLTHNYNPHKNSLVISGGGLAGRQAAQIGDGGKGQMGQMGDANNRPGSKGGQDHGNPNSNLQDGNPSTARNNAGARNNDGGGDINQNQLLDEAGKRRQAARGQTQNNICMYALDSLRQLIMKFLSPKFLEALKQASNNTNNNNLSTNNGNPAISPPSSAQDAGGNAFAISHSASNSKSSVEEQEADDADSILQCVFLQPLEIVLSQYDSNIDNKQFVISIVQTMIRASWQNLRSGWKTVRTGWQGREERVEDGEGGGEFSE
jgi:hypothetical protein